MIFRTLLAAVVYVAATLTATGDGDSREYSYINFNGGMSVGLYEDSSRVRIKDLVLKAQDCSTDTVVCFQSEGMLFALPYRSIGYASDGTKVETVERRNISLFGVQSHVHLIQATRDAVQYRFLYSYERGLLAFTVAGEGMTGIYLAGQASGFKATMSDGSPIEHPKD